MNEYNFPIVIIKDRKPTIMDDETQGYIVGQPWVYQEENNQYLYYVCIDNSQSNANWIVMPVFSEYVDYLTNTNCVDNSQNEEYALKLKEKIEAKFEPKEILISEIGAAVGSHAGPGTLAVSFKNSEKIAEPELY